MFEKYGFLGSQIESFKKENHQQQSQLFSIAFRVLETSYLQLKKLNIDQYNKKDALIGSLFCKIIDSYNSILLLSNSGLLSDSKSILRVFIEAAFLFGSLIHNDEQYEQFLIKGDYETLNLIKRIIKNPNEYSEEIKNEVANKDLEELTSIALQYKKNSFLVGNIAKDAGMNDVYFHVYHSLCKDVHTNVKSLFSYIKQKDDCIESIDILPKYKDQEYVLVSAVWILIRTIKNLNYYFNCNGDDSIEEIERELKPYMNHEL